MFVEPGGVAIEKSVPIPVRAIACGAPGALSAMVMAPFRVPVAVGVKVTLMVQLAPAATLVPFLQVVPAAGAKSPLGSTLGMVSVTVPAFVSVTTWVGMVSVALPVLVSVAVCGALIVPSGWAVAKVRLRGDSITEGPV